MSSSQTSSSSTKAAAPVAVPEASAATVTPLRLVTAPVFPGLMDVVLPLAVRLGSGTITVGDCLSLKPHSLVRLTQSVGQDLDLVVNGETVARGEVAIVDDSTSIRLTDISVTSTEEVDA